MTRILVTCAALFALATPGHAQSKTAQIKEIAVAGNQAWVDTGIDVQPGDRAQFEASGQLKFADAREQNGPEGLARGWRDLIRILPLNDAGRGALIGRVGSGDAARPFLIGARRESHIPVAGRLFVGLNIQSGTSAEGSYKVKITIAARADEAARPFTGPLPAVTDNDLDRIPRRVIDKDGNEGDRVNFLILGGEEQVKQALAAVGWVVVDRSVRDTILRGALGTLSRQAYLTMPMSELMAFGRPQDYGYAMSDPVRTVASRHHFRLWKAPFTVGNSTLWVGAGTHDIGFDKDQRTGGITHKIDPETDKEREFIAESLKQSGTVVKTDYVTPTNTITRAKTAHGEEFSSDGRILIVWLKPEAAQTSAFGDYFCSVLKQNNPDGGDMGSCEKWMETPGKSDMKLGAIAKDYRVLVIPGIMNTCVSGTPAFEVGRKVLNDKYGVTAELLSVANDSSEQNAKAIARYITEKMKGDARKYIVVGYSKGTPDLQTALALEPGVKENVAAFISVAGATGGSPIADSLPVQLDSYLARAKAGKCEGNLADGFKSLKKDVRQRFLAANPHPAVKTYSLAAITTAELVPKTAAQTYRMLAAWDKQNDSQLLKPDQIIPESTYLGAMWSDHLNIALAMGGQFPRAALFESLIRFVFDDLAAPQGVSARQ